MSDRTRIEWADATWNPITGCTPISEGCENCYARRMSERFYGGGFEPTVHVGRFYDPLHWRKPRRVFVCSMGDLFHKDIRCADIQRVLQIARALNRHTFMFLTKRPERMRLALEATDCNGDSNGIDCSHMWFGVTAENQKRADERIPLLFQTPTAVRFVSVEPMLGPVDLDGLWGYPGSADIAQLAAWPIRWVICGAETGPGARPMDLAWARDLRDQCRAAGVPFFFKSAGPRKEIPEDLLIREFPKQENA